MGENAIIYNEYLKIFIGADGVYIETYKKGFPVEQLPSLLHLHPEVSVTNITVLRSALLFAPKKAEKFGEFKGRINLSITPEETSATITFNMSEEELSTDNREALIKEVQPELVKKGIVYGIKKELFAGLLENGIPYTVAEGIPPVHGTDAVIRMYEMKESRPHVTEDGKVDLYELKLINRVKAGDWLGERLEATTGTPGKSIRGVEIKQLEGKTYPLNYDRNTIQEVPGIDKTLLFARINGAVNYTDGKIGISDFIEINGDIGVSTGNINFDGYVTVKGTICDGFSLEATKDIEINGELGLGNIKSLVSTGGSIFIKGGINSKSRSEIRAAKSVFTKFSDNAAIYCGKTVHIGFYCLNSIIEASEVIIDSLNGHIIGGSVKAKIKVVSPYIGSAAEKKTVIEVTGFNRQSMVEHLNTLFQKISSLKTEQQKLKQLLTSMEASTQMNTIQKKDYMDTSEKMYNVKEELKRLEEERKTTAEYLQTKGDGEIAVSKTAFPNCTFIMQQRVTEITKPLTAVTFCLQDGQIKQL